MKSGNKLFVFAGVGLALVAILLVVVSMSGGKKADAEKTANSTKVKVVQAALDIPAHQILTSTDVIQVEVPSADAPADAVLSVNDVIGQAYRVSLTTGQTLVTTQMEVPGLRNDIEPGKRAMALPVNDVSLLSGLLQDGDYVDVIFHARINLVRDLPTTSAIISEDGDYSIKNPVVIPPDLEQPNHPAAGDPGSVFEIRDDVGDSGQLEPVAKIMLQDIKILRVVRPGETYQGNGSLDDTSADANSSGSSSEPATGQVILEVTPEQAEFITFIQDQHQQYQLIVRAKDDHTTVTTNGITYTILATDPTWELPWPTTITAPLDQSTSKIDSADGDTSNDATPEATPEADS